MTTADHPLPEAGDIVWVDLRPTLGREQSGVRPAVVLSDVTFHLRNATAIICPITSNVTPWPTKLLLPDGLSVSGAVLLDHIRCVDRASRGFRRIDSLPADFTPENPLGHCGTDRFAHYGCEHVSFS